MNGSIDTLHVLLAIRLRMGCVWVAYLVEIYLCVRSPLDGLLLDESVMCGSAISFTCAEKDIFFRIHQ